MQQCIKQNIHVLHIFPTLGIGGMELVMSRVVRELTWQGIRHSVVCLKGEPTIRDRFADSVPIYCMHAKPNDLTVPWRLWQLLRSVQPTVIQALNWSAWPDVALARLALPNPPPLIFGFHGLDISGPMPFRRRLASQLLAGITTKMFTVSEASKRLLIEHVGLPKNRVDVIPNGIDTTQLCPPNNVSKNNGTIVIGTVGSLSPVKNQSLLIRACAQLLKTGAHVDLCLAGEGSERPRLTQLTKSLGIGDHVHLLGHIEDIPGFLQNLDIFVLPSNSEAHPVALLEAMACELPCVATSVGGVAEILDYGRFGRVVKPEDEAGLVCAIAELAKNQKLRYILGRTARNRVCEEYSSHQMINAYSSMYRQVSSYGYFYRTKTYKEKG
jgi:glycosyltransferase involved in cell wall biosynthesis